jgi:dihydrofolate synthase/folylpolyglutamate synthase
MAASEYAEVLASLYRLEAAKGMDFKLERVALALKNLGNPQQQFAAIHIAGTNGKGSVAAMLHSILGAGGYRVALYTSPHLLSFTERIRIGAREITEEEVVDLAREIHGAATVRGIELTFFEFVTVMAFLHFARQGVDLAVVEVGLGGRLDATNVLDSEVAVITTIGLDHQEFLGDTVQSVAREKAGIIKPRRPVIIGRVPPEVATLLAQAAAEQHAAARWLGSDFVVAGDVPFRFDGIGCVLDGLSVGLRGSYQHDNAATAIAAALQVRGRFPLSDTAIRRGLANVRWPGRLDIVQGEPLVLLDGAHNVDGMVALAQELPAILGDRRVHVLFAVMRDKRWQRMVDAVGPLAASATVTTVLPPRGETAAVVAPAFTCYCPVHVAADPLDGLKTLLQTVDSTDAIVVCGSLFLVGAVYPFFMTRHGRRKLFDAHSTAVLQP